MPRSTVVIELAGNAPLSRDLAAGGVFVPGCTLRIAEECELVVCGANRRVSLPARVVYVDERRGAGLELIGFSTAMRQQLAELAPIAAPAAPAAAAPARPPAAAHDDGSDGDLALPTSCRIEISGDGDLDRDLELDLAFAAAIEGDDDLAVPLAQAEDQATVPVQVPVVRVTAGGAGRAPADHHAVPLAQDAEDHATVPVAARDRRATGRGPAADPGTAVLELAYPDNGFTAEDAAAEIEDDFAVEPYPVIVAAAGRGSDDEFDAGDDTGADTRADEQLAGAGHELAAPGGASAFAAGDAAGLANDFSADDAASASNDFDDEDGAAARATVPTEAETGTEVDPDPGPAPGLEPQAETEIGHHGPRTRTPRHVHERLRGLTLAAQVKLAAAGELHERIVLERLYGKNVWETLLRNPRLTAPEVARIARFGALPRILLEVILGNNAWLQIPEVRRALLANPRLGTDHIMKVLRLTPKHELRLAAVQTAYPHAVRNAARTLLRGE